METAWKFQKSPDEKEDSEEESLKEKKIHSKEKIDYNYNNTILISKAKKCYSIEDLYRLILNECKTNKKVLESLTIFKKYFEILYINKIDN